MDTYVAVEITKNLLHPTRQNVYGPPNAVLPLGTNSHGSGDESAFRIITLD